MADISESELQQLIGKSWDEWDLPLVASPQLGGSEAALSRDPLIESEDNRNLLPESLMQLVGTRPSLEYISVTKCPSCLFIMKTEYFSHHLKTTNTNLSVRRWRSRRVTSVN